MRSFVKIDGVLKEIIEDEETKKNETKNANSGKIMENIINHELVNKSVHEPASTVINGLSKHLTKIDVDYLYNEIVACDSREKLESIINNFVERSIANVRKVNGRKENSRFQVYKINPERLERNSRDSIKAAPDSAMYAMVSKIIGMYYRNAIDSLNAHNPEAYENLVKIFKYDDSIVVELFTNIDEITDANLRLFAINRIKTILRMMNHQNTNEHLCSDCPAGYPDTCPKIAAPWDKHLADFDFITDGYEIDFEPKDKPPVTRKNVEVKSEEELAESLFEARTMVKQLVVTGCLKEAEARNKAKRKSIYKK